MNQELSPQHNSVATLEFFQKASESFDQAIVIPSGISIQRLRRIFRRPIFPEPFSVIA